MYVKRALLTGVVALGVPAFLAASGGSVSAEHGVGILKKECLARYRSGTELDLMQSLKRALDPQNTLNPGKVI